jgi:predicted Zn-ribbon and HTH transcriptional regulator
METQLRQLIDTSINGTLYDIANVVHFLLKHEYVSARLKNKLWFKYDGLRWKQIEEGPYYELSTSISSRYETVLKDLLTQENEIKILIEQDQNLSTNDSDDRLKQVQSDITKVQNILDKLKNVTFKEAICKECLYLFYDPDFMYKLDLQQHLVCFKNALYDIKHRSSKIPNKSDMISIYIDADYVEPSNEEEQSNFDSLIDRFMIFRKNLVKKRQPKNAYSVKSFV